MKDVKCPYEVGMRLWVKETFMLEATRRDFVPNGKPSQEYDSEEYMGGWRFPHYRATDEKPELINEATEKPVGWSPSIFMPRWASRLTLEVTEVKIERLNDITWEDAYREGCRPSDSVESLVAAFEELWQSIRGPGSWALNPWVWAIGFRRVDG